MHPSKRYEIWRFVTYMFVHKRLDHLLGNLIAQCIFGTWLELVHSSWRVAAVYVLGVITGSMLHSVENPGNSLIGASGGVYALFTAHIASIIMNWQDTKHAMLQLYFFIIIGSTEVLTAIYCCATTTSNSSHLGGSIAGFLVGILVLEVSKHEPYKEKLWWIAGIIYSSFMTSGMICHTLLEILMPRDKVSWFLSDNFLLDQFFGENSLETDAHKIA